MVNIRNLRAGSIPSALKRGHGRAYYTNGPLVAGASSLPANLLGLHIPSAENDNKERNRGHLV